jgi:hypothetical protein
MTRDPGSSWRIAEQVWEDDQAGLAEALTGTSPAAERAPAAPPAPDLTSAAPGTSRNPVSLEVLLERVADRVEAVCRQELASLDGLREATQSMAASLQKIDTRLDDIERRQAALTLPASVVGTGKGVELTGDVRQLLDALLTVAQHIEAVQTSTAWAIVRELRTG